MNALGDGVRESQDDSEEQPGEPLIHTEVQSRLPEAKPLSKKVKIRHFTLWQITLSSCEKDVERINDRYKEN